MSEVPRIIFLIDRDGVNSAIEWVRRTLCIYRSSVLNHKHFASSHEYRRRFIESYLSFKHWLKQQE